MSARKVASFVVRDTRNTQYEGIGRRQTMPWKVVEVATNQIVDEYVSGRAARMCAAHLNREARDASGGTR